MLLQNNQNTGKCIVSSFYFDFFEMSSKTDRMFCHAALHMYVNTHALHIDIWLLEVGIIAILLLSVMSVCFYSMSSFPISARIHACE